MVFTDEVLEEMATNDAGIALNYLMQAKADNAKITKIGTDGDNVLLCVEKGSKKQGVILPSEFAKDFLGTTVYWHHLKENPNDLPKNEGWVCNQDGLPCWYDITNDQWLDCDGTTVRTTAWCDMPHLKENEK